MGEPSLSITLGERGELSPIIPGVSKRNRLTGFIWAHRIGQGHLFTRKANILLRIPKLVEGGKEARRGPGNCHLTNWFDRVSKTPEKQFRLNKRSEGKVCRRSLAKNPSEKKGGLGAIGVINTWGGTKLFSSGAQRFNELPGY